MGVQPPTVEELNARLKQVIGFTDEDVAANRQKILTDSEKARILKMLTQTKMVGSRMYLIAPLMMGVIFVVVTGVMINMMAQSGGLAGVIQVIPAILILGVVLGGIAAYYYLTQRNISERAKTGNFPLKYYTGKVDLSIRDYGYSMGGVAAKAMGQEAKLYSIRVQNKSMYVDKQTFSAFQHGRRYDVFCVSPTNYNMTILSAECLE